MMRSLLTATLVLVLVGAAMADLPQPRRAKLIAFTDPGLEFIQSNPEAVERAPIDGVNIRAVGREGEKRVRLEEAVFSEKAIRYEQFEEWVAQARATDFRTWTDNFLCVYVVPGDMDWFGDCAALMNNIRVAARVAREAGLKGIFLDCEPYGFSLWDYRTVAHPEKSFEEYYQQIRRRGEEFARAMYGEWPEMTLMLTFGYKVADRANLKEHNYGLYGAFLDGLFVGSPEEAEIIDGWEMSYGDRTREDLLEGYWWVRRGGAAVSGVPDEYLKKVRAGFGLWPDVTDRDDPFEWNAEDFSRNYYSPSEWRSLVRSALETTDGYVWIYAWRPDLCTGEKWYPEYREATREAKESLYGLSSAELDEWARWPLTEEFAREYELIVALPEEWRFRLDPYGRAMNWHLPELDDSEWHPVVAGEEWQQQLPIRGLTGVGWGRVRFEVPAECAGRRLYLWFGACDEEGDVYLNGRYVYTWTNDFQRGWETPFAVEVTDAVLPGQENVLAVRVRAASGLGGVFKRVYLYAER